MLYMYLKCVLWSHWVKCSINVNYVSFADSLILYTYLFYLCCWSINHWESSVVISDFHCIFLCFPCSSIIFCFTYFESLLLDAYISKIICPFDGLDLLLWNATLFLVILFSLKSVLSDYNIATPVFLC